MDLHAALSRQKYFDIIISTLNTARKIIATLHIAASTSKMYDITHSHYRLSIFTYDILLLRARWAWHIPFDI